MELGLWWTWCFGFVRYAYMYVRMYVCRRLAASSEYAQGLFFWCVCWNGGRKSKSDENPTNVCAPRKTGF